MDKTQENLMTAFAGESQANRKYLAFAQVADKEGLTQVAKLFRATAAIIVVCAPLIITIILCSFARAMVLSIFSKSLSQAPISLESSLG